MCSGVWACSEPTCRLPGLVAFNVAQVCGRVSGWPCVICRWRPYRVECTGSLPTSEVKRRRARLVLGWETSREDLRVLPAFGWRVGVWPGFVCILGVPWALFFCACVRPSGCPGRGRHAGTASSHYGAGSWLGVWVVLRYLSLAAIPRRMHRISSDLRS